MTNTDKRETFTGTLFIGGALYQLFHKHFGFCILLLLYTLLNSCKTVENKQLEKINNSSFVVKSVKKQKNGVYVIYAYRNESIFKIVSYYDGKKIIEEKG
ncbi:hypothetical protein [Prevotella sp.]|uniref:hypothetical protein n=1 Tax=Prevotella sp. TaxID=59823 RepID=UPI003DA6BCEA